MIWHHICWFYLYHMVKSKFGDYNMNFNNALFGLEADYYDIFYGVPQFLN